MPQDVALPYEDWALDHPGQRVVSAGEGHGERSAGEEPVLDTQKPGSGSSIRPPGHTAPLGQGAQSSPEPHAHTVPGGSVVALLGGEEDVWKSSEQGSGGAKPGSEQRAM